MADCDGAFGGGYAVMLGTSVFVAQRCTKEGGCMREGCPALRWKNEVETYLQHVEDEIWRVMSEVQGDGEFSSAAFSRRRALDVTRQIVKPLLQPGTQLPRID